VEGPADNGIAISMDGKGAWRDVFVERLWRSVKYEEVYLRAYRSTSIATLGFNTSTRRLNRSGKTTGHGNSWTEQRVRGFREHHDIANYCDGEWAERGEITLDAAAEIIGVCKMTALRMLRRGDERLPGPVTPNPAQQTFEFQ
jgi:hypothetical protein